MSFEAFESKNEQRARKVLALMHGEKPATFLVAIAKVLANENITHEPDVKRIMREVGLLVAQRKQDSLEDYDAIFESFKIERDEEERRVQANEHILDADGNALEYEDGTEPEEKN